MIYPQGLEIIKNTVYVFCPCGKKQYWMERADNPLRKFPLPEGWTGGTPLNNYIMCPECTNAYEKNRP